MMNKRFAVQILYFDCEQFILRTIANCAPHVEKIFITYSPLPWSAYNKDARNAFPNPSNPDVIRQSPFFHKIELITGVWDTEEDQRNDCLQKAKAEGFDYLIIQDADEFYLPEEYQKNIHGILENPDHDYYRNPWFYFWKNINTVIVSRYPMNNGTYKPYRKTTIAYNACFAVNCNKPVFFSDKRLPNSRNSYILNGLCLHLSYVLSDEQLLRKLKTWGHSSDFNIELWYNVKWLGWKNKTKNLHPITSIQWVETKAYSGLIPEELSNLNVGTQKYVNPALLLLIRSNLLDIITIFKTIFQDINFIIKKEKKWKSFK